MAAHFGDMLLNRRRQMGLSIQQVANTIKIRPQIIEFFETENFGSMPPRGYAQGMISSYARFLGLNPREVVEAYFDALAAYERAGNGYARGYQEVEPEASPRSANATGRFLMVGGSAPSSRYGQRPPQAGYIAESNSPHEHLSARELRSAQEPGGRRAYPRGARPAGARGTADRGQRTSAFPRQDMELASSSRRGGARGQGAQGRQQRAGSRGPAGRGGSGAARQRMGRNPPRTGGDRRSGRNGTSSPMLQIGGLALDPRLLIGAIGILLLVILIMGFMMVRGCTSAPAEQDQGGAPQAQVATGSSDEKTASGKDASDADASDADKESDAKAKDADADAKADAEPKEKKVKVSIGDEGTVAWLEVKLDGKYVLSEEKAGPFEEEYTVSDSIEITTDKPSDVTVTEDGEKVDYDTKVSGVAKVTITVPQASKDETAKADAKKSSDEDAGTDAASDDAASGDGSDGDADASAQ